MASHREQVGNAGAPVALARRTVSIPDSAELQRGLSAGLRYRLALDSFFGASHSIRPNGEKHTHSYRVQAVFVTERVDENGMVAGFREVLNLLEREAKKFANRYLNELYPFTEVQPTGENVAAVIFRELDAALLEEMPGGPILVSVTLWENPTVSVTVERRELA
ncbi:6-carboxytetrahydropterin synthase [Tepidiforma sp.]|uniref:6-pyruvoyl trahydropterin synthase family protein n=1 Tax=Tepidiforma sp. TaxID=2682230 RepID=UPI002ADDF5AD|nr:6-carboxytetrahydropterin synthase [Tepidiforma sp.]